MRARLEERKWQRNRRGHCVILLLRRAGAILFYRVGVQLYIFRVIKPNSGSHKQGSSNMKPSAIHTGGRIEKDMDKRDCICGQTDFGVAMVCCDTIDCNYGWVHGCCVGLTTLPTEKGESYSGVQCELYQVDIDGRTLDMSNVPRR